MGRTIRCNQNFREHARVPPLGGSPDLRAQRRHPSPTESGCNPWRVQELIRVPKPLARMLGEPRAGMRELVDDVVQVLHPPIGHLPVTHAQ